VLGTVSGTVTAEGVSVSAGEFFKNRNQVRSWPGIATCCPRNLARHCGGDSKTAGTWR